ncbi:S41 family peptidase [Taibaiella soli]|uniref:Tail specific protease domain-containing protein n=1 Tax=Taibaiella soli TaxID=1649169 RepID=A0A2W2A8P3_9BACT|nr:S41 family peptidase [Taibaiella soli]PZF71641.1 hypothetical protein DN068_16355 [Taibaiella soli]
MHTRLLRLKSFATLCFTLLLPILSSAQSCDCSAQFQFIKTYFETNNPSFQTIKKDPNQYKKYEAAVQKTERKIAKEPANANCTFALEDYVSLLHDHHSSVEQNPGAMHRAKMHSEAELDSFKKSTFYQSFEKLAVDTTKLLESLAQKDVSDIEGLYLNHETTVGIYKTGKNKYKGVVLRTKTKFLELGQVMFELKRISEDRYQVTYNLGLLGFSVRSHAKTMTINDGHIYYYGYSKSGKHFEEKKPFEFKSLNDSTNYMRISTFNGALTMQLDTFYEAHDAVIRSKPNLIIDLRDNGGGADRCFVPLVHYLYTGPIMSDTVDIWVTPENIRRYQEILEEQQQNKDKYGNAATTMGARLEQMKRAPSNSFILMDEKAPEPWTIDSIYTNPKKVVLLYNKGTASSGEAFIWYAMQSKKVITAGENSGGYMGFGNVMESFSPCDLYKIYNTTTRYRNFSHYEYVGIEPQHKIPAGKDWIEYAKELLK